MNSLCTVRFVAHGQHCKLLDVVDKNLPEAPGQHGLCFLAAPVTNAVHQDLARESSAHSIVNAPGFHQLCLLLTHRSVWSRMNLSVLFLPILGFPRGPRAAETPSRRRLPPAQAGLRKRLAGFLCKTGHSNYAFRGP